MDARLDHLEAALSRLAEAQAQTTQQLRALVEAQARTEARLEALTARVDQLAGRMDQLAQAQARTEARLEALTARVDQLAGRMDQLAQAQARTEARLEALTARVDQLAGRMDQLAQAQARTETQVQALTRTVERLTGVVGDLRGELLERRYRDHAAGYFQRLLRRIRVVPPETLEALAEEAETQGRLSSEEHAELLRTDLVVTGRRREDEAEVYLAIEVSAVIDEGDVERAARRAALLARLVSEPVLAVVAGERPTPTAEQAMRDWGVWGVLNGTPVPPGPPPPER